MISILVKKPTWAVTRPASRALAQEVCVSRLAGELTLELSSVFAPSAGGNAARLRGLRRPQDQVEQGIYAFAGMTPTAPTAHVAAADGGVSGPHPWRPPV